MKSLEVDVAVIGAGTAGLTAWRAARSHGQRVLLIEGGVYGTTCARVGCMPSKLLIAAAEAAHTAAGAARFGVHAGPLRIDGRAVMARVQAERDRFVGFVLDGVEQIPPAERLRGQARFLDAQRLQVDAHTVVQAGRVVVATGSSPVLPEQFKAIGALAQTSDDIFEWPDLPQSVAVIGTGIIGLELGQALHRLGVRVALFGRRRLAQLSDPVVQEVALRCLGAELDLRLNAEVIEARRDGAEVVLSSRDADGAVRSERYDVVLCATGRAPNVGGLGLERAGIELDRRGVPLFDPATMRCGASTIFIAGDASSERPLLHEAANQGRIAGDNAGAYPHSRPGRRHEPLAIVFSDPQIASVGSSWQSLKESRAEQFAVGQVSFENQGRSRVMLQNQGVLRLYGEYGSDRFLGAEMIAPRAEHLAHLLAWACQSRMTVAQMRGMPFYHPVIEEGVRTALRDLQEQLAHGLPAIEHCADCTPGM
ncbi:MAG TPA: dihydrolipoyl dehydrogenase [Burkholderiaceae bacterium]|nr:dihydrolipoyl dehydrogenase [Burkholderiaceae bacterium]